MEACNDDDVLKRQVGDAMQEALENYIEAQNRILGSSAATIKEINDAAKNAQDAIASALKDLKNIKNTLNAITKAVKTVGIIVAALP